MNIRMTLELQPQPWKKPPLVPHLRQFLATLKNERMNVTVLYKGAPANFAIRRESPGIYYADLMFYEGDQKKGPPDQIMLMRGVRYWAGSHDDKLLLSELGEKIEALMHQATRSHTEN